MSEEIVLWKLKDLNSGVELGIRTPFIEREIQITKQAKVPLYKKGVLISDEQLAELKLERVGYTQTQIDTVHYAALYAANPDLMTRVRQYKAYLDEIAVDYASSMDEILVAIDTFCQLKNKEKALYGSQLKVVYDAIITNMEFSGSDTPHMDVYIELAKMIQYLPEAE